MVKRWVSEFKVKYTRTNDEPRSGSPVEETTPEIVEIINRIPLKEFRLNSFAIAGTLNLSK